MSNSIESTETDRNPEYDISTEIPHDLGKLYVHMYVDSTPLDLLSDPR